MGPLLSKPEPVKPPKPAPPVAIPEVGSEVEDIARRKQPRGRRGTFLTGELIPGLAGKKKTLG